MVVRPLPLRVACVDLRAMIAFEPQWSDLTTRAAEPNAFLSPAFAIPLLQHVPHGVRPMFLLAWEDTLAGQSRLVGLLPIDKARPSLWFGPRIVRGYHHAQVPLGTPLVDSLRATATIEAMLAWLGQNAGGATALILHSVPAEGPFAVAVREAYARRGRGMVMLDTHHRAVLRRCDAPVLVALSAKRCKELRRQRRRLEDHGALTYRRETEPAAIRRGAERFLALEFEGWKGRRGTALLADRTLATFTRTMTRLMAQDGRCRIDSLEIDGAPVAMGILVMAGDRAHFWKTTYSERYAMLSPGVQFTLALTQVQATDPAWAITDSCAIADHPMIDRLWTDRLAISDLMLSLRPPSESGSFTLAVRLERLRRTVRGYAKRMLTVVMGRLNTPS